MELTERELAQLEALREVLRARIVDTMVLKNQLIQILECLTVLVEQRKGKT